MPEWLGFIVHPHGYLTRIDVHHPAETRAEASCRPSEWGANRSLVWIKGASSITRLYFMFHPDPIDYEHLKAVIGQAPEKYMQIFDVSAWAQGAIAQVDTLAPDQLDATVLEFKALSGQALQDVASEQIFGLMGCNPAERAWGNWEEEDITFEPVHGDEFGRSEEIRKIVQHPQPDYPYVHGRRLRQVITLLQAHKGAVVACEDPIGIAQELSMHHLTAAVPYVRWLQQEDGKGVSNQFKQAASASIRTIQSGLQKAMVTAYDEQTHNLRRGADNAMQPYPGSDAAGTVRVRQPDGSDRDMTLAELNRQRSDEWRRKADLRDSDRAKYVESAAEAAALRTRVLYDGAALDAFDKMHKSRIQARDDLMDAINADLQGWLQADAFTETALGRYNQNADPARSPDGLYCAGQLCAILLQMDSAPKGRHWYAALDTFTPGQKNLVWRMLSFNNKTLSAELEQALQRATDPLTYGEKQVEDVRHDHKQQQAVAKAAAVLASLSKLLKGADVIGKAQVRLGDPLMQTWTARVGAYWDIGKAAKDNIASVLLVSALARVKKLEASALEAHVARGQILLMAHGMGSESLRFAKSDLTATIQNQRVPMVLGGLSMLSIIPKLGKASIRQDARSVSDASASVADAIGLVKNLRANFYDETVLKQVPRLVPANQLASKLDEATQTLRSMKARAAVFVVAGAAVGVWWDVVDGAKAYKEKDILWVAYVVRAATGAGTIGTAIAGVFFSQAPVLLARINICLAIGASSVTFGIGKLQGKEWVNWLLAQPFRVERVRDADKNAFTANVEDRINAAMPAIQNVVGQMSSMGAGLNGVYVKAPDKPAPAYPASAPESQVLKYNLKTPFRSEAEMMRKLSDALSTVN